MKIKKIAPSLISSKVALPIKALSGALNRINRIKQPFVIEGILLTENSGKTTAVLLAFIPHDQRKLTYNFIYGLALSFMKLASKEGGRPCATGAFFKGRASSILGKRRRADLIAEKKRMDPHGILNPGKVISGPDALDFFMAMAQVTEPAIRFFGNQLGPNRLAKRATVDIPTNLKWHAYSCDQCGFCLYSCPSYQGWESQSHRGRWYLLRKLLEKNIDISKVLPHFEACNKCRECKVNCPLDLPRITPELVRRTLSHYTVH